MQASREVVDLITGAWRTQAVYTAVKLGLPDHIESGQVSSRALAERTGVSEDVVHRLMRLLVSLAVFEGDERTGYRNTALSSTLLSGRPGSLRDMCLLYGEEFYTAWGHAQTAVATGIPGFEQAYGQSLITYLSKDEEAAARFQRAMQASNFVFDHVPEALDFSGGPMVVDVGGGSGQLLASVLRATPDARGTLVDLDHMVPIAREQLAAAVGLDRVELVARDIFASVPAGGDVYLLSRVLGDWDDDACVQLLGNIRRAMADIPAARLVVLERVTADDGSTVLAALWDLHLLVMNGGRQRTLDDYRSLFARSGLRLARTRDLPMETTALVAEPTS
ncbi:methyltransferase [Streptomyces sp. H27-D2]|uniref:methyltransferase n=1 Tax=Streptomyces sp. H27-D2 TaxID=3046304 RepID=UPI002DB75B37|nr:methyltransferase [Streptomyces sp. H27-D2]MEC4019649.1 methyltransferase [Streptomyces sp. H27-D2]